jgi:hypothetical protein
MSKALFEFLSQVIIFGIERSMTNSRVRSDRLGTTHRRAGDKQALAKRERPFTDWVAGMYGDLQGIVGKSMPEVEGLSARLWR